MSGSYYTLADGEERNRLHPDFWLPPKKERITLTPGNLAKLIFESDEAAERMWVIVQGMDSQGDYFGRLDNKALSPSLPALGERVVFQSRHVIQIDRSAA